MAMAVCCPNSYACIGSGKKIRISSFIRGVRASFVRVVPPVPHSTVDTANSGHRKKAGFVPTPKKAKIEIIPYQRTVGIIGITFSIPTQLQVQLYGSTNGSLVYILTFVSSVTY